VVIVPLAMDLWTWRVRGISFCALLTIYATVHNVSGRTLVGLRFRNQVGEGSESVRSVVDLRLLLIYFHLFPLLSRLPRLARHRTRALRHSPPFHDTVPPCTTSPSVAHVAFHNARSTTLAIMCQNQVRPSAPPRLASSPSTRLEMAHSAS
jgi:hypothetical protein